MPRFNPLKSAKAAKPKRPEPLPTATLSSPTRVSHIPTLTENAAKDGLELRFGTKPSEAVLALFRGTRDLPSDQRWHWHFRGKFWYAPPHPGQSRLRRPHPRPTHFALLNSDSCRCSGNRPRIPAAVWSESRAGGLSRRR